MILASTRIQWKVGQSTRSKMNIHKRYFNFDLRGVCQMEVRILPDTFDDFEISLKLKSM
jgi:hypothetical protein